MKLILKIILNHLNKGWSKFINHEDQKLLVHSKDYGAFDLEVNSNWKFAIENYCESYHPTNYSSRIK
jgi:hypothetical protein